MGKIKKHAPKVAIWMVTYNHEKFIKKSIESVLNQKTHYEYKLYINEDCSTDKTAKICLEYKLNNPEKIELICNKINIGSNQNGINAYKTCLESGADYIALCEGDDYWIDSNKLQKQINFLEANHDYNLCFHNTKVSKGSNIFNKNIRIKDSITLKDLINENFIHTSSVIYRNILSSEDYDSIGKIPFGDYFLFLMLLRKGSFKFIKDYMSVYRVHENGIFSKQNDLQKLINKLKFYHAISLIFDDTKIETLINSKIKKILLEINFLNNKIDFEPFIFNFALNNADLLKTSFLIKTLVKRILNHLKW